MGDKKNHDERLDLDFNHLGAAEIVARKYIAVSPETHEGIDKLRHKDETYGEVVAKLLAEHNTRRAKK